MKRFVVAVSLVLLTTVVVCAAAFYLHPIEVNDDVARFKLWRAGVRSQYVQLGPYRIHYLEDGPYKLNTPMGTGAHADRPIVLVHGLGARAEDWTPIIEGLAQQGFHVYALDLLGYGRSPRPDVDYSIPMEENILLQFLDSQQLQQPNLAGWSMGGWIAAKFALDYPDRVRRLLLYDAAGINFTTQMSPDLFVPQNVTQLNQLWSFLTPNPRPFPAFVAEDLLRRLQKNGWVVQRNLATMMTRKDILDGKLGGLRMPVLIVWGSADRLIPLQTGEKMHAEIPQSVLDVESGCGHLAPAECASTVLPDTVRFMDSGPAATASQTGP